MTNGADGVQAKPGVRSCGVAAWPCWSHASEMVSVGASWPMNLPGFTVVNVALHGPYDARGKPFFSTSLSSMKRIARTRQWIVAPQPRFSCSVKYSRSSATFVVVWNETLGWKSV